MAMRLFSKLANDSQGAVLIETAIVAPVLLMLSLGGLELGRVVTRQTELQSAVAEAGQIAIAAKPDTQNERNVIKNILVASAGLDTTEVTVTNLYRCGADTTTVNDAASCDGDDVITTYLNIAVTDTYNPIWTGFGLGSAVNYSVTRQVIVA